MRYFLRQGYVVLFLYRESSKRPFRSYIESQLSDVLLDGVVSDRSISCIPKVCFFIIVSSLSDRAISMYKELAEVQTAKSLLEIPFTTVFEYMVLFRHACLACSCLGSQLMVYSAAAVSDFYVPLRDMNTHKIQSSDGKPHLALTNTPKMLFMVSNVWAPDAYLVSFKLETDAEILLDKATSAISK